VPLKKFIKKGTLDLEGESTVARRGNWRASFRSTWATSSRFIRRAIWGTSSTA